jgi:aryl-alcohol dehydrogenase-like predicted oxidoreductase
VEKWAIAGHKLVLLSKCYGVVGEVPEIDELSYPDKIKASRDYVNQGGLSRVAIYNAVDASLERLRTPYLDVLQIHCFDAGVPIEETMKALHDLVECEKVRYLVASSMWCYQFARMKHIMDLKGWTKSCACRINTRYCIARRRWR